MQAYVSFLRAINVGGTSKIQMPQLRKLYEDLGCSNVRTILQTGNVLFDASRVPDLEDAIWKCFQLRTAVIVRTQAEIEKIVQCKPFARFSALKPTHQMVVFLSGKPVVTSLSSLPTNDGEEVWSKGKELYITYPSGIGRSKLTIQKIESATGVAGTMRNWNTIEKISKASNT